ncbi:DUF1754 domain-containing protein [Candidatus Micrarchaeota archaeon]|nr:DUF1754 domain-containing protein [Candidatus Micrarchaeota archaeon]
MNSYTQKRVSSGNRRTTPKINSKPLSERIQYKGKQVSLTPVEETLVRKMYLSVVENSYSKECDAKTLIRDNNISNSKACELAKHAVALLISEDEATLWGIKNFAHKFDVLNSEVDEIYDMVGPDKPDHRSLSPTSESKTRQEVVETQKTESEREYQEYREKSERNKLIINVAMAVGCAAVFLYYLFQVL